MGIKRSKAICLVLLSGALFAVLPAGGLSAAAGLQLVTPYPSVVVESGKTTTFNIEVVTATPRRVNLSVIEAPPGWQATLNGGGFTINGVFGKPNDPPTVQLNVNIPAEAAQGDYRVLVKGDAAGAVDILQADLKIAQVVQGAVSLAAEFPTLKGASDKTFNYKLTLTNNSPEATTFNLSAAGPEGWEITARPTAEEQATTVKVEGGGTADVQVDADPPDTVGAGKYEIKIKAESGSKVAETTVTADITGSFKIALTTRDEKLDTDAVAGKKRDVELLVKNEGTTPISGVTVSSSPPSDWKVDFKPATLPEIAPKQSRKVIASITPSGNAVAGDYLVKMTASGEGSSEEVDIRVAVKTSRLFGLLGIGVILAAVYILFRVFGQYGRR